MYQAPLPAVYASLNDDETRQRITDARRRLDASVMILGHHYQREDIIIHADFRGDSFKLCKDAARRPDAETIVFCGVHFMAESADILTPENQRVILPNMSAGCSMADMANIHQVRACWLELEEMLPGSTVLPITYINSAANLKAFVGERDGSVCTSSNAKGVIRWALDRSDKLLFFPDQHLGRNTAVGMGFDPDADMALWDPRLPLGGNTVEHLREARILLWKGHCSVHGRFTVKQIDALRQLHPNIRMVVHPECTLDVVQASEFCGSTEFICKTIEASEPGSKWGIGTEINLVKRLANENPDKLIVCLDPIVCPCSTMYRIHPSYLLWVLDNLSEGNLVNQVKVSGKTAQFARLALDRMLEIQ